MVAMRFSAPANNAKVWQKVKSVRGDLHYHSPWIEVYNKVCASRTKCTSDKSWKMSKNCNRLYAGFSKIYERRRCEGFPAKWRRLSCYRILTTRFWHGCNGLAVTIDFCCRLESVAHVTETGVKYVDLKKLILIWEIFVAWSDDSICRLSPQINYSKMIGKSSFLTYQAWKHGKLK